MAWKESSFSPRPDLSQYDIPGKYWEEAEIRESFFEEVGGSSPTGLETSRITGRSSVKKKSDNVWPTFGGRDGNGTEEMQGDRKLSSSKITFRTRKTDVGHPRAKEVPRFATCRQPEKGIDLVSCKAGISGLLFSPTKCNNTGPKRYGFGSWGCTSAPEVYLPASASKVVRASADWDSKKSRQRSSKVSRGSGGGRKSSQKRSQVAPQPNPMWQQVSRRQTTPIVDPDMWCSRGLAFTTDPASLDCVVPTGNVHVSARQYRGTNTNSSKITPGTQLDMISREEHYSDAMNGDDSKEVLDSDAGLSVARSLHVNGSRRLSGGLGQQLLMLEATLILGGLDIYDQHRDLRLDVDNMSYEDLLELGERIGYVSTGLSEEKIFKCIKKKQCIMEPKSSSLTENDRKCSICQEEYEIADEIGKLHCGHGYHVGCIKKWLLQKNLCPVCKASALS